VIKVKLTNCYMIG